MAFEIRQALRTLLRNPAFALICIATLALGIGISTAVFTVVNGVLLEPLGFPEPDRIVSLNTRIFGRPNLTPRLSGGDYVDIRASNEVFDAISMYWGGEIGVQLRGQAEFTGVRWVNPDFFRVFGKRATPRGPEDAIVSAAFALRHFGSSERAIGQTVHVENRAYTIAGVLEGQGFPARADVWLPASHMPENMNRTAYNYRAVARLKPGVAIETARANLAAIAGRIGEGKKTFVVNPLKDQLVGQVRTTLYLLLGSVLLVLLIACGNVSNLLLARATVRAKEIAVRAALGASRVRIARQLLMESAMLALPGGVAGTALAWWGMRLLLHFAPANLPRTGDIRLNYPVLLFALALSAVSALLFGVLPAWQAASQTGRAEFSARGVLRGGSHRLRNSLVVGEIALSFVLAMGAGLFFRSLLALNAVDMGFRAGGVLVMYAHAPAEGLNQHVAAGEALIDRLLPELASLPGATSSAAVMGLPAGQYGSNGGYAVIGKHTFGRGQELPEANFSLASPDYFAAMRIPLLRGREFTAQDQYNAEGVAIVSQALVRDVFGGEDPIGRQIQCGLDPMSMKPMTIVGVVGDVRQNSPGTPPSPTLYMPLEQHPFYANEVQVIVRTAGAPAALTSAVREAAHRFNPEMAVRFTTLDDMVAESVSAARFRSFVAVAFGSLALLLAMAGVYGVMSYVVSQRTSELGLRMALGAAAGDVVRLVLSRAGALAALGLAIGVALSLASAKLVGSFLFGLTPTDPSTYATVLAVVALVVTLAAAGPAMRAARIDPMVALREE